ncbi:hypothetical protein SmJEL517_g04767 [Synchytrium microbalum]|uniref:General transcription and DNA repair factor IIH subunit TFB4 n=1 Tax=Synchytrium microbalum TaxID=1806994 RepID=A0A507BY70_9FUNG|nr:uncharacterized protein SmJEL517_g04767 [Synchytrium microbalum]TPX32061.1 hypothetical protein SmJEL517_g04767 [Synchytrium microbalum]
MNEEKINLLVAIIDLSPSEWAKTGNDPSQAMNAILMYINTHLAYSHGSDVAVIAAGLDHGSKYVYPSPHPVDLSSQRSGSAYHTFWEANETIAENIKSLTRPDADQTPSKPAIASALAMALAYISKKKKQSHGMPFQGRILVLSVSPDNAGEYVGLMNASFSAQKSTIPIDVCRVFGGPSVFLGQASYLTKGVYHEVADIKMLLQTLITLFLADVQARDYLVFPAAENVDLRAACFCHRRIIDKAFVCSVCLAATGPEATMTGQYIPIPPATKATASSSNADTSKAM